MTVPQILAAKEANEKYGMCFALCCANACGDLNGLRASKLSSSTCVFCNSRKGEGYKSIKEKMKEAE